MRAFTAFSLALLSCSAVSAQVGPAPKADPAAAPAASTPAAATPAPAAPAPAAATPAAPPAPDAATAAPAAPADAAATAAPPASAADAPGSVPPNYDPSPYAQRMLDRARLRLKILRARERDAARGRAEEAEPVYGDAGAALAIGLSIDSAWNTHPSYDVYADNDVATRFGLWLAHDVVALRTDTILAAELGYGYESEEEYVLGAFDTELVTHSLHAGAQLRWVPVDFLQPHARLAVGAAFVNAKLSDSGTVYEDGAQDQLFDMLLSPFASLGLGATLRTPTRTFEDQRGNLSSLSLGVMVEGGYTFAAPVDVELNGPGPEEGAIPIEEAQLGTLERKGPYVRVSLVGRF